VLRFAGIGALGLLALVGVGFIAMLVWAWQLVEKSEIAQTEGEDFGRITNDQACLAKVVDLMETRQPWIVNLEVEFLRACLKSASPMPGFCDGVPPPSNEEEGQSWRAEHCEALSLEETNCHMILSPVQYHCIERKARATK
jgi:hypothetical protein